MVMIASLTWLYSWL